MLTYNMDVTPESVWKRTTPSEAELAQPYYCTEAGVFYAQQHFSTARTDKESYILFYTPGAGLIEQGGKPCGAQHRAGAAAELPHPAELLHRSGAKLLASLLGASGRRRGRRHGAAAAAGQKLTPVQLTGGQDAGIV